MKVLLLQDVKKIGRKHEVKEVADGYARNFLIARKLAVPADAGALKVKAEIERKEKEEVAGLEQVAVTIKNMVLEFPVKSGSKNEVFGSVTNSDIQKALESKGFGKLKAALDQPLKTLGEKEVVIDLGKGVKGIVKVKLFPQS